MADSNLEAEIRTIIYDDYGVGHQNIDSEEIYNKLIERGFEVPECAMGQIFDSLKKRGLIKGIRKMNRKRYRQNEPRRSPSSRRLLHYVGRSAHRGIECLLITFDGDHESFTLNSPVLMRREQAHPVDCALDHINLEKYIDLFSNLRPVSLNAHEVLYCVEDEIRCTNIINNGRVG
jgi:hypothetical protein